MFGYLFYSKKCENSGKFITIITQEGIIGGFNLFSIDEMPKQQIMSLKINMLPAVIVKDGSGNSNIFEGTNAFTWLNGIMQFRRQNMAKIADQQRRRIIQTNQATGIAGVGIGHSPMESTGVSDEFAYLLTDHAQPKAYMKYGDDDFNRIATPRNDLEKKMKDTEYNAVIKQYSSAKDMQDKMFEQYIDENIKTTICNNIMNPQI